MRRVAAMLAIGLLLIGVSCGESPRVIQGVVAGYSADTKMLTLTDENPPGESLLLSLEDAEMGAPPAPGDVIRVSYRTKGDRAIAIRVMHISSAGEHTATE
ncbi:MAG: hypothetical protein HY770_00930 [Chitinivibrionia bacterium]|nr:hypothetical protein [Chitinivibrionia bacterium]